MSREIVKEQQALERWRLCVRRSDFLIGDAAGALLTAEDFAVLKIDLSPDGIAGHHTRQIRALKEKIERAGWFFSATTLKEKKA